jgi:MFS family permease
MSGILQQGYSFGYVLAACANLGVGGATNTWKTVFWVGAGFSIAVGFIRVCFPESKQFLEAKKAGHRKAPGAFWAETKQMLRKEWKMCVYCIILMTWVCSVIHHQIQEHY